MRRSSPQMKTQTMTWWAKVLAKDSTWTSLSTEERWATPNTWWPSSPLSCPSPTSSTPSWSWSLQGLTPPKEIRWEGTGSLLGCTATWLRWVWWSTEVKFAFCWPGPAGFGWRQGGGLSRRRLLSTRDIWVHATMCQSNSGWPSSPVEVIIMQLGRLSYLQCQAMSNFFQSGGWSQVVSSGYSERCDSCPDAILGLPCCLQEESSTWYQRLLCSCWCGGSPSWWRSGGSGVKQVFPENGIGFKDG